MHSMSSDNGVASEGKKSFVEKSGTPLDLVQSIDEAAITDIEQNAHGQFHRSFTPRQVHIISLGSNIGSGLFIATGKALANGGPGNMVIAYALVCSCVWAVLQSLSEMTIAYPVSGNFLDYADRWVDPALAFGAGFAEWLGWAAVIGAEATFFNVLIQYWADGSFPLAASISIFLVLCMVIFLLPNTVFAWFEYVTSMVKIIAFLVIIFASLAITLGAGPKGYVHHGNTWTDLPVFKKGFSGFANCALLATWAVGDQIFIGIIGGEAQNPRFSMAHATKLVPFRVNIVYMISIVFVTILVPSNDPRLLGGSGVAASPFVIAINNAGIKVLPDILNVCIMIGLLAISAESIYICSRILRAMAYQGLLPQIFAKVDSKGRPRTALIVTCLTGVLLSYINLSGNGQVGFVWLLSITSAAYFSVWIIISFTNFRFHQAIKAQKDPLFSERYAWSSSLWPLAPSWLMAVSLLLLVCCIAAGIVPVSGTGFSAYDFFQYMIGFIMIVVFTIAYKVVMRTPWRNPATADLRTGRRKLTDEDLDQLDRYYAMSKWRRFLSYVQLW